MNFELLKKVIAYLKKNEGCLYCFSGLNDNSIHVLSTSAASAPQALHGIFFVICPDCNATAFVLVQVTFETTGTTCEECFHVERKGTGHNISMNEVLDMHNFLKSWEGDVKELFKEI